VSLRAWLFFAYLAVLAVGCIRPYSWTDMLIEHSPTVLALTLLVATRRRPLSDLAYTCLFVFMVLHAVGAHYTYSLVPYDRLAERISGRTLSDLFGWERNHYDRLVHFAFGLLTMPAALELMSRAGTAPRWRYLLAWSVLNLLSTAYELLEWGATLVLAPDQAEMYNGQQGDMWDAQKDLALAGAGALISGIVGALRGAARGTKPAL
jgi:putative membrane protein